MGNKRSYNSELREKRKQSTINNIIMSTYQMHSEGITDIKTIAENAGVSVPTIRKYFPTNEDLFKGCAAHFMKINKLPEIYRYFHIDSLEDKVSAIVTDFYSFHEDTMELVWLSFRLTEESKVMRNSTLQNEAIVKAAAEVLLKETTIPEDRRKQVQGYVQGLLHPLFYRTLRVTGGLEKENCIEYTVQAIMYQLKEEER
ncbi:TetR/AcrR family transcriptional regulator [Evansella sp. LMS18]|uniref:TetR/AcrR family transcriptional regulator n=1 Tax=Evansella sp. LMS18 TaxID=2924033 RepID=UPI0020D151C1|nr:TetR/AcrR family transcriptional regulator [Evansella sp. LMS18]UTR10345.1 TetR/AcrR family transcriptional regulator [Evansella sp. LMS18]